MTKANQNGQWRGHRELDFRTCGLARLVAEQLATICENSTLTETQHDKVEQIFKVLTAESLGRDASAPFAGLSYINANGLPFQWVFRTAPSGADFGFLCEVGVPGETPQQRYSLSRKRLAQACEVAGYSLPWLDQATRFIMPDECEAWPPHWRSAIWIGVVPTSYGILLKPYFNLNRGSARNRWLIIGRLLQNLGRHCSLARLCKISGQVSQDSWPVGLTIDAMPNGKPGRIKVYFRSGAVTADWLDRWYKAADCASQTPIARRFLELFPWISRQHYPVAAFTVSLEFHPETEALSLKTDLAVTKWMFSDKQILQSTKVMIQEIGGCSDQLDRWLCAVGVVPTESASASSFRFVGLGHEPDGSSHVNVYVEPRIDERICRGSPMPQLSPKRAIEAAVSFLLTARSSAHWKDFDLPVGSSDAWVTAYALAQLAKVPQELRPVHAAEAMDEAIDWLARSRSPNGGWGYNKSVPDDADSTSWAIVALKRHHNAVPSSAKEFLLRCRDRAGAFCTYPPDTAPCPAWALGVPDVTALSLYALGKSWSLTAERLFLLWRQPDGFIPSYWWTSRFYTLAILLDWTSELARFPHFLRPTDRLDRANVQNSFDTSLLLSCLATMHRPRAQQLASSLCLEQNTDGSWCSAAILRLPLNGVDMPWTTLCSGSLFSDQNAIFTTATAMSALCSAL